MFKPSKNLILGAGLLASLFFAGAVMAQAADASAAAATPVVAAAGAVAAAAEENPYGLGALWAQGDFVAKGTLLILVIMSMGSWYVIFTKLAEQSKLNKQAAAAKETFWSANTVAQGKDTLAEDSAFRFIAEKGLEGASKHTGLLASVDFNEWVSMSIQRAMANVQSRMQDGLAVLATVGSTAPFVGLFGTVWGIYHALVNIGTQGQVSIATVAGPIGEALVATAAGLAAAIPAVMAYNTFVRLNRVINQDLDHFTHDLHAQLLTRGGEDGVR